MMMTVMTMTTNNQPTNRPTDQTTKQQPKTNETKNENSWAQYEKHFNLNSGFFYLSPNERTVGLMARLEDRLSKEKYWDQTAYNEEIFFLSHDDYVSPQVGAACVCVCD